MEEECFFYLIQFDKDICPTWGKVGRSIHPLERLREAQIWWPRPKLLCDWSCMISDEKRAISYMKRELECKFFGEREIFKCEDFDKLIGELDKWFLAQRTDALQVVVRDWTRTEG